MIDCACADGAAMSIVESKKTQVSCRDTLYPLEAALASVLCLQRGSMGAR
jgi:hypothetical protein